jgi:hypothetical protein
MSDLEIIFGQQDFLCLEDWTECELFSVICVTGSQGVRLSVKVLLDAQLYTTGCKIRETVEPVKFALTLR